MYQHLAWIELKQFVPRHEGKWWKTLTFDVTSFPTLHRITHDADKATVTDSARKTS